MAKISVEYIDHMGDDLRAVNSARVSFNKRRQSFGESDESLIRYLAEHNHFTPFTHPQITLVYNVPIFVARQEFKHVVGFSRNEISRRYVSDAPEFYHPDEWRTKPEGNIKQGSGQSILPTHPKYAQVIHQCSILYEMMINEGYAPEQARMILPQNMMTSYFITGSLFAFSRMVNLRLDPHAQSEIRDLAKQVHEIIKPLFPISWSYLMNESDTEYLNSNKCNAERL